MQNLTGKFLLLNFNIIQLILIQYYSIDINTNLILTFLIYAKTYLMKRSSEGRCGRLGVVTNGNIGV
jgi:hypothetical protein